MAKDLIVYTDPKSPISEIFRTLRTNIQFSNVKGPMKSLIVTSTTMSEGKSWTALNLATSFAQTGNKVIMVDADIRRGRLHKVMNMDSPVGLSNYLASKYYDEKKSVVELENCVHKTNIENLLIVPIGTITENPAELLLSKKMQDCVKLLAASCDTLIIDTPPVGMVTDALILARMVDGILVVAEQNKTTMDALKKTVKDIRNVGGNILGVVLNKVNISKKKYERSYYYRSSTPPPKDMD